MTSAIDEYNNHPRTPADNKRMTVSSNRKFGEYAQPEKSEINYKAGPPICKQVIYPTYIVNSLPVGYEGGKKTRCTDRFVRYPYPK